MALDDDKDQDKPADPTTPNAASNRKGSAPGSAGNTPKSAPAAAGTRARSATTKPQPTLLSDFLLGRPSPARIAADKEAARQRRMTLEQVKQEMRQETVRKVQPPGGVHDRVKQWQKKNAAAMEAADPLAAPSEPSDIAVQVDEQSVTEEDRVRIKKGQKRRSVTKPAVVLEHDKDGDETEKEERGTSSAGNPPKKRVVSDTNWMKNRKRSPQRKPSPKTKPDQGKGSPLPKDFLTRPAPNPPVKNKIKAWAERVEIPDEPRVKRYSVSRSVGSSSDGIRVKDVTSGGDEDSERTDDLEIVVEHGKPHKSKASHDDGIRVTPLKKKANEDDGIRVAPLKTKGNGDDVIRVTLAKKKKTNEDDGIRVTPAKKKANEDDGIRIRPQRSTLPDDGIRVYSSERGTSEDASTVRASSRHRSRGPSTRATSSRREPSSERIEVIEEPESEAPNTPTRRSSGQKSTKLSGKSAARSHADTGTTMTEEYSDEDEESWTSGSEESGVDSDIPSSLPSKLAEIPVGYSAFSELDLTASGKPRRPKAKRNSSFKGATNVLKQALTQGKKIITEKVDPPPKPVANQPRSIESWLNKTVDPFVEATSTAAAPSTVPEAKGNSIEQEHTNESNTRRSTLEPKHKSVAETESELTGLTSSTADDTDTTLTKETATTATTATEETVLSEETASVDASTSVPSSFSGLRRSRATRSPSSPIKPAARKGFKDLLKEAFRGESAAPKPIPTTYPSCSEEIEIDDQYDNESEHQRRSSVSRTNPPYLDDESSYLTESSRSYHTESSRSHLTESSRSAPPAATHSKRRPPTKGVHELSTILSEQPGSTIESDLSSMLSESTVTQTNTTFTGGTESNLSRSSLSRHRSNRSGLKRRLTKHSDLVSVLSLPDESPKPGRSSSLKSRRSVRRPTSHLNSATVDALLHEFARDEDLYLRELKTLVDGVIPVLLIQVAHGNDHSHADLLSSSPSTMEKGDSTAKSVVQMGIALEKLRNLHKRCPMHDAHRLPQWLDSVHPTYDQYLNAWQLGFEDLIVNLAPRSPDDNDSLINALPRNEQGDVLNEDGERVDVAHLLKKPLIRVKYISKFVKGYRKTTGTDRYQEHEKIWETLEEKVRRRHKEETARIVDEDATNTDVTRVRDLRTLEALDSVRIDRFRQVYAKDLFFLDLRHTNGQRIGCQVELISRDSQLFKSDPGDLLIRETGSRGRTWLLFAPVTGGNYSARKGDAPGELVVMIRGNLINKDSWYQVITLTTDNDEQVEDWLDILGTDPVPPEVFKAESTGPQSLILVPQATKEDTPLGEKKQQRVSSIQAPVRSDSSPEVKTRTPARYHKRTDSAPTTPTSPSPHSPSLEKTPTQESYSRPQRASSSSHQADEDRSHPLRDDMRPEFPHRKKSSLSNSPHREDCPPPPPAHRTLPSKRTPKLSPPELTSSKVKRRTSSPLKHEYHPSDISSEGSTSASESEDDDESSGSESSDDELEAADMPDTAPAISIKPQDETPSDSVISYSSVSLTPSASVSQAAVLPDFGVKTPTYVYESAASISYWDNKKGCWMDLWPEICSIITTPGLIEAYPLRGNAAPREEDRPLIALDLTPLVMLRNSTVVDLEIRSPVLSYARLYSKVMKVESTFFRFRSSSYNDCEALYIAVHKARMDNAKYIALEEEARVRAFGQNQVTEAADEEDGTSRRRSWFGRKNSYRVSTRAPSQSGGSISQHSSQSASSFLKRLMGSGNTSFDIGMSSIDKQSHRVSADASLYASSSGSGTPPRSPSVSAAHSGNARMSLTTNNLKIRLHLMVSASKWEDHGNCTLEVTRPDQGTRQNLRKYQGLEKRVVVSSIPKKSSNGEAPKVILDVVLGSRCFTRLGSRGILLNVWEEVRDEKGDAMVGEKGGTNVGQVNKWCFQCASVTEAGWIYGLVTQEVVIA